MNSTPEGGIRGIYIANADGSGVQRLLDADSPAVYAPSGHLLFQLKGALSARPFDPSRALLTGEAIQVAGEVMSRNYAGSPIPALCRSRTPVEIVYRTGTGRSGWVPGPVVREVWDQHGATGRLPVALNPALSPDDRRAALFMGRGGMDIYLLDLLTNRPSQFTFDPLLDFAAVWSPGGTDIIFSSIGKDSSTCIRSRPRALAATDCYWKPPKTKFPRTGPPTGGS